MKEKISSVGMDVKQPELSAMERWQECKLSQPLWKTRETDGSIKTHMCFFLLLNIFC